jgi:hypothetical protein
MVRKSRKGVVGKALPTATARYDVGPGIDFKSENLSDGDQISSAVRKEETERGLK